MTQCPPGSMGAKPALAWSVLSVALVLASVAAFVVIRLGFRSRAWGWRLAGLFAGIGVWGVIVYAGLLGFLYYMFTCF